MKTIEGALTDEQIVEAGYMHTVEDDEPLFAFDRKELIAMVRELLARAQPPVADGHADGATVALTTKQKAALDLAVLNLKSHGDDQLLAAVTPLIDFYAATHAPAMAETGRALDFPNLEGLREKLLAPRETVRDVDGWLWHPDYPTCDEGTRADKFLEAFGIEPAFVAMESDSPDFAERWHEEGLTNCSEWAPTLPDGDGWVLLEIYDTEDGPYALFGRDIYAAEQARKKENTRRLSESIRRARIDRAAASGGEQG